MVDPKQFRASLFLKAPHVKYHEMGYGTPLLFSRES
jgi:hypothetical protein